MTDLQEYKLNIQGGLHESELPLIENLEILTPFSLDAPALSRLLSDASGNGWTAKEDDMRAVRTEIAEFFLSRKNPPMTHCSRVCWLKGQMMGACLVDWWDERQCPRFRLVFTASEWKSRGLARVAIRESLLSLIEYGYNEVRVEVVKGNLPAEQLCKKFGFEKV